MIFAVLAAAAVAAPHAPASPSQPTAQQVRQALACQRPAQITPAPVDDQGRPRPMLRKLGEMPDAHLIRAVVRNYCNQADVLRLYVSEKAPAAKAATPIGAARR